MSFLFSVENKIVKPSVEALLIHPFKEIWERDTNPGKINAIQEFTYIEFMCSVKKTNVYRGYPLAERHDHLSKDIFGVGYYTPDALVQAGMSLLDRFQKESSSTYAYYQSARAAADKLKEFFENFDMNEKNEKSGLPVYKPKDITTALIDTEKVLQNLLSIEQKVNDEIFETIKIKGNKKVSLFADPDSL